MTVEAPLHGATLAALNRVRTTSMPVSVFASFNLTQLTADLILWPCKRLQVPAVSSSSGSPTTCRNCCWARSCRRAATSCWRYATLVSAGYGLSAASARPAEIVRPRFI